VAKSYSVYMAKSDHGPTAFLWSKAEPPEFVAGEAPALVGVYSNVALALDRVEELEASFQAHRAPPPPVERRRAGDPPPGGAALSPEEMRVRCYHEAGHALMALHLGVRLKTVYVAAVANVGARTLYEPASYGSASTHVRALLALAGGIAEEVAFGQRAGPSCEDEIARLEDLLDELGASAPGLDRDERRGLVEDEAREILGQAAFRAALDVLAQELGVRLMAGPSVMEWIAKKCPEFLPSLAARA
jgi:hypothetical protein